MKRLFSALVLAAAVAAVPNASRATDYSVMLTTTPVQVVPAAGQGWRNWLRLVNVGSANGPTGSGAPVSAWCSRVLTATSTPVLAPYAPGAFELAPAASGGRIEDFTGSNWVPTDAVWCVAASGTVPITAEANQR